MTRDARQILWFTDSPDEGDPRCICSWCRERIEERPGGEDDLDDPDEHGGIRIWDSQNREARFHDRCFTEVLELGLIKMNA